VPPELTKNQIDDIRDIRDLCAEFNADFVIIGAIAYKLYFPDEGRFTADIDAVIALDSDEFVEFARILKNSVGNVIRTWNTVGAPARIVFRPSTGRSPIATSEANYLAQEPIRDDSCGI